MITDFFRLDAKVENRKMLPICIQFSLNIENINDAGRAI